MVKPIIDIMDVGYCISKSEKNELGERIFKTDEDNEWDNKLIAEMVGIDLNILKEQKILPFLKELFNEILRNEHKTIKDINYVGKGCFSNVYQIGDLVIKFGENRGTPIIPDNKYLLMPILRTPILYREDESKVKKIENIFKMKRILFFVEVQPYVEVNLPNKLKNMIASAIEKKLRKNNIVFEDASGYNIGVCSSEHLKKFENSWYGNIKPALEALGIIPNKNYSREKKCGDFGLRLKEIIEKYNSSKFNFEKVEYDGTEVGGIIDSDFLYR